MACLPPRTVLARFRAHGSPSFSVPEAYFVNAQHSHEQRFGMEPRTVSLPLSVWLSSVLPRLIPWLIQNFWLLHPLQANVGYYGDSVTIQVAELNQLTSLGNPAFQHD